MCSEAAVDLTSRKRIRALRSSHRGLRRARTAASAANIRFGVAAAQQAEGRRASSTGRGLPPRLNILPMPILWQRLCVRGCFAQGHRIVVPYIHPDIHRVRAAAPVAVNVAEKVQRAFAGVVPGDHRVVAKCHRPVGLKGNRPVVTAVIGP